MSTGYGPDDGPTMGKQLRDMSPQLVEEHNKGMLGMLCVLANGEAFQLLKAGVRGQAWLYGARSELEFVHVCTMIQKKWLMNSEPEVMLRYGELMLNILTVLAVQQKFEPFKPGARERAKEFGARSEAEFVIIRMMILDNLVMQSMMPGSIPRYGAPPESFGKW